MDKEGGASDSEEIFGRRRIIKNRTEKRTQLHHLRLSSLLEGVPRWITNCRKATGDSTWGTIKVRRGLVARGVGGKK